MRAIITLILLFTSILASASSSPLRLISLPANFHINIYARGVTGARQMALAPDGTVFVGTRRERVYALLHDSKKSKKSFTHASKVIAIAHHLNAPNGVAFYRGALYVAETNRILKYGDIEKNLSRPERPTIISTGLPDRRWHGYRYIKFSPDGWLYTAIGAPCNICLKKDPRFASIIRMRPDGSQMQIMAKGVRNSVGFAWHPVTKKMWFTDNGRDWLGDDLPPDELNLLQHPGMNFGFPYLYGNNMPDPRFGKLRPTNINFTKPVFNLPAHVAALGVVFYTGKSFPEKYQGSLFIAEHGSWNRTKKVGYRVSMVKIKGDHALSYQPLFTGWLQNEKAWGRPVDLLVLPDGSLLISDDLGGVIYRISFSKTHVPNQT